MALGSVSVVWRKDGCLSAFRAALVSLVELGIPTRGESPMQINYAVTMSSFDVTQIDAGILSTADKEPLIDELTHSQCPTLRLSLLLNFSMST